MSRERPILFSGPMVRALLNGRKTQTRRVVKQQPKRIGWYTQDDKPGQQFDWHEVDEDGDPVDSVIRCPYGAPGDRLWVRETFAGDDVLGCVYRADHPNADLKRGDLDDGDQSLRTWQPCIFMPRECSRLTLEVTKVRIERVQDVSEYDATQEGVEWSNNGSILDWQDYLRPGVGHCDTARDSFRTLWDSINGGPWKCWDDNPWVWVVSFKRVEDGMVVERELEVAS